MVGFRPGADPKKLDPIPLGLPRIITARYRTKVQYTNLSQKPIIQACSVLVLSTNYPKRVCAPALWKQSDTVAAQRNWR